MLYYLFIAYFFMMFNY